VGTSIAVHELHMLQWKGARGVVTGRPLAWESGVAEGRNLAAILAADVVGFSRLTGAAFGECAAVHSHCGLHSRAVTYS
jgi:hypothetical protein